jgi:predicted outer membrane protein
VNHNQATASRSWSSTHSVNQLEPVHLFGVTLSFPAASAKDIGSETFLNKAIEGNYAEISMGELAQKNGQSDGVKSCGKMLSTDHETANQKAIDAAKAMGMNPPTRPDAHIKKSPPRRWERRDGVNLKRNRNSFSYT